MKKCPFCAEEIQDDAIKCKHCKEFLDGQPRSILPVLPESPEPALAWYFRASFIVVMLLILPPFALPSVLLHPKLHPIWKLVITAAVVGASWLTVIIYQKSIEQINMLIQALDVLKS